MKISTFLSISTLNTNGLNAQMTKSDWMDFKKERSIYLCSLYQPHFRSPDTQMKSDGVDKSITCK